MAFRDRNIFSFLSLWHRPLFGAHGRLRHWKPRYFRLIGQTVVVTPFIMGLAAFALFTGVPQMEEVYRSLLDSRDIEGGALGLFVLGLFSALLYSWNWLHVTRRIDCIYPSHADLGFDRKVLNVRDFKTILIAALPFAGLMLGVLKVYLHISALGPEIDTISEEFSGGLAKSQELQNQLKLLAAAAPVALALTGAAAVLVILALHFSRRHPDWYRYFIYFCYALAAAAILAPILLPEKTLTFSRDIGPLAGAGLVLIAGAILMRLFFWALTYIAHVLLTAPSAVLLLVPRTASVLIAIILIAVLVFTTFRVVQEEDESSVSSFSVLKELKAQNTAQSAKLTTDFEKWLAARRPDDRPFPVFIVAAEGGGIYAASAAAFFLATLQDHCPQFAKHVFAISAVSGGSIGASLFNAGLHDSNYGEAPGRQNCDFGGAPAWEDKPNSMIERLSKITLDDHITPVMAYLLPDLIHGLVWPSFNRSDAVAGAGELRWIGRDQILEQSFVRSFEDSNPSAKSNLLQSEFSKSWSPEANLPALMLNTTWVETGFRVAFSPFPLRPIGKGTLYSFNDLFCLPEKIGGLSPACLGTAPGGRARALRSAQPSEGPKLIEAAVVSARFPVIMPPKLYAPRRGANRWTFVDGGYADSSGATTALDLYNELERVVTKPSIKGVELHLIVLTDALTEPDLKSIDAAWYDDFISPLNTLLTVRRLLAKRAVAQAYHQLEENLIAVELDQKTFPLPLGWKISKTSSNLIRFMLGWPGRAGHCSQDDKGARPEWASKARTPREEWAISVVRRNSCQLERIAEMLKPAKLPEQADLPERKGQGTWDPLPQ